MHNTLDFSPVAGNITNWPQLKLTTAHIRPWEETRAAALWVLPHITDVWYAMMVDREGTLAWFTDKIPTCATDDKYMYINPVFYFKLPLEQRVFVAAHEVLHAIFNHCGLMYYLSQQKCVKYQDGDVLPYIPKLMNIAMDCLINVMLVESQVGGMPKDAWYLPHIIKSNTNALEAYRTLYKLWRKPGKRPPEPGNEENEDSGMEMIEIPAGDEGKSFDQHLKPGTGRGKTPSEAEAERNQQEWDEAVNAAMKSAKNAGRLPGNMERIFKLNMEVPTPWQDLMAIQVSEQLGNEDHSWMYLDGEFAIRGIGFPAQMRHGCNCAITAADSSGSINQPTTDMFLSNIATILSQVNPKELWFTECDDTIYRFEQIQDIADLKGHVRGGGGTSVRPVFKRIEEEGLTPDVLIYFTDLDIYDGFPDQPDYPVIWACTEPHRKAPWGQTIYVPPLKANPETL